MKSFKGFQLDPAHECLWHDGTRLPLTRKAFAVLNCLVENAGQVVSKEELLEKVWPNVYVGEENLKVYIRELRALLGDSAAKPIYIETYRDRGYSFISPLLDHSPNNGTHQLASRLYGRTTELVTLQQKFERVCKGSRQIVFVTGEPGIGKTSIIEGFLAQLTGRMTLRVALGQCIESYHEREAFYPVLEAFGRLLKDPAGADFASLLASQAPTWLVQFPSVVKTIEEEQLHKAIVGAGRERMLREICEGLEAFTAETPLILVLEDLHWSDPSTLDFIAAIARRREPARLMVIATYRPVEVILSNHPLRQLKSELCTHSQANEIPLEFLTISAVEEYLATRFSESVAAGLANEVVEKTDGNPLFVVALMDQLVNQQVVVEHEHSWNLNGNAEQIKTILPNSLIEIFQKQIEQFSAEEQRILTAASVVGTSFSATVVSAGLEMEDIEVENICDSLARRQLWLRRAGLEETPDGQVSGLFQFIHALHRDALYNQCSPITRLNLHRRVGEAIEKMWQGKEQELAGELARHFMESRDHARVVHYLQIQAEHARHLYAYSEALALLDSAIQFAEKLPPNKHDVAYLNCQIQLAHTYDQLGNKPKAAELYTRAAERAAACGQRQIEIDCLVCLSRELSVGDTRYALEVADRAVQLCDDNVEASVKVNAETWANFLRMAWTGWDKRLAEAHQSGIEWLGKSNQLNLMAQQAFGLAVLQVMTGDYLGGLLTTSEIIPRLARQGDALGHFTAHWFHGWALLLLGRGGESHTALSEALALVQKNNNAFELAMGQLFLAELYYEAFDPQSAITLCEEALTTLRQTNSAFAIQRGLIMSGMAHLASGNRDTARNYLFESSSLYASSQIGLSWYYKMPLHCALAEYWLLEGKPDAARQEAERMLEVTKGNVHFGWRARAHEVSCRVAIIEGDFTRAQAELADALEKVHEKNSPLVSWRVHNAAARLYQQLGANEVATEHLSQRNVILHNFAESFGPLASLKTSVLDSFQLS